MREMNLNGGTLQDFSYIIGTSTPLERDSDPEVVREALHRLIDRHESLRTGFRIDDEGLRQVIWPTPDNIELPVFEVKDEHEAKSVIHEAWGRSFPVESTSLFRPFLIRFRNDITLLVLCIEHLVADSAALRILSTQFNELYDQLRSGTDASSRPQDFLQFKDWAREQRKFLDSREDDELAFWRSVLGEAGPFPEYSIYHPMDGIERAPKRSVQRWLRKEHLKQIDEIARARRMSRFMVLLYVVQTALMVALGRDDVVVHSSTSNRTTGESQSMVGWCAHGLPFRTSITEGGTLDDQLLESRRTALEVLRHQALPLTRIVRALRPEAHGSQRGLRPPRIFLAFDDKARGNGRSRAEYLNLDEATDNGAKQFAQPGLTVEATIREWGVDVGVIFGDNRFDPELAETILNLVTRVLTETSDNPKCRLSDLRTAEVQRSYVKPQRVESS